MALCDYEELRVYKDMCTAIYMFSYSSIYIDVYLYIFTMEKREMAEELITNQEEGVCPNCKSFGCLEYRCDNYYLDGDYLVFPFVCEKCGFKGEELNSFVFNENRGMACSHKDDEIRQKEKVKSSLNRRNMHKQAGRKNMSVKPASNYLGVAGRYLFMMQYRQRSKQKAPSKYVRNHQRSLVVPYKPITAKLSKLKQGFLRAAKKQMYLPSGGKVAESYGKESSKLYSTQNTRAWFRSLDSYLN